MSYIAIPEIWNVTITSALPVVTPGALSNVAFDIVGDLFSIDQETVCRIGDMIMKSYAADVNRVRCSASMDLTIGNVIDVAVSNDGVHFSDPVQAEVSAAKMLQLSALSPSFGSVRGGNTIVLQGSNLDKFEALQCVYGWDESANRSRTVATILNESAVQCTVNGAKVDEVWQVPVTLYSPSHKVSSNYLLYRYVEGYTVHAVTPTRVLYGSTVSISVKGSRFVYSRAVRCLLRDEKRFPQNTPAIVNGKWKSPYEVECKFLSNTLAPERYQVELALNGVDFDASSHSVEVLNAPEVTKIWPVRGPSSGNTSVALSGSNFALDMTCCFADVCAPAKVQNESSAICTTPSHASGNASIALSLDVEGGHIATGFQFEFVRGPEITFVRPSVLVFGAMFPEKLSVGGANFDPDMVPVCTFGGSQKIVGKTVSSTLVECPLPHLPYQNHSIIPFSLLYEGNEAVTFEKEGRLLHIEMMKVSSIHQIRPNKIAIAEGTTQSHHFEFQGHFYFVSQQVLCQFDCSNGDRIFSGQMTMLSHELADCEVFSGFEHRGDCTVTLVQENTRISSHGVKLTISDKIHISTVSPSSDAIALGMLLKLDGTGFTLESEPMCHFGRDIMTKGFVTSATTMYCSSPKEMTMNRVEQEIELWVSDGGIASMPRNITFQASVRVTEIAPTFGPSAGGTRITVLGESFSAQMTFHCVFDGNQQVIAQWHTASNVSCVAPTLDFGRHVVSLLVNGAELIQNELISFNAVPLEVVHSIHPAKGVSSPSQSERGAVAVVHGANFIDSESLRCKFDEVESMATFLSSTRVECAVPLMRSGVKIVRIANNGFDFTAPRAPVVVTYGVLPNLIIDHTTPQRGPVSGGTIVHVIGFFSPVDNGIECVFGEITVLATMTNSSHLSCIAPAMPTPTKTRVDVRFGSSFARFDNQSSVEFEYVPSPEVRRVVPSLLSQSLKPVPVTISGIGFDSVGVVGCRFSGVDGALLSKSSTELMCLFDASFTGSFDVEILTSTSVVSAISTHQRIRVVRAVEPRSSYPSRFDERGGAQLIITAHNVFAAALSVKCRFRETVVDAMVLSEAKLRCITPPLPPGKANLYVTQDGGVSWSSAGLDVLVFASPQLFSVAPLHGVASGEFEITVFGTNFKDFPETSCRFDSVEATAVSVNESAITCITPSFSAGRVVSLWVSLNDVELSSNALSFAFNDVSSLLNKQGMVEERVVAAQPECPELIHGVSFTRVSSSQSSQAVTLSGFRFGSEMDLHCQIGSKSVVQANIRSDRFMKCDLPRLPPGNYSLQVICGAQSAARVLAVFPFEFLPPIVIDAFSPQVFPARGHFDLELHGHYFTPFNHLSCRFGRDDTAPVSATYVSPTIMRCATPVVPSASDVPLAVYADASSQRDQQILLASGMLTFTAHSGNQWTLVPNFGSTGGSFTIQISGDGAGTFMPYRCKFVGELGEIESSADPKHAAAMDNYGVSVLPCDVPRLRPGKYVVYVTPNGRDYVATSMTFAAHAPIHIERVAPLIAVARGGTYLVISGRGFHPWMKLECGFRTQQVSSWTKSTASYVSSTQVECIAPRHTPGNATFQLLPIESLASGVQGIPFTFTSEIVVHSIRPQVASAEQSTVIDVVGQGFYFSSAIQCRFHDLMSAGTFVNSSLVRCRAPPHAALTTVPVQLLLDGINVLLYTAPLSYHSALVIDRVYVKEEPVTEFSTSRRHLHIVGDRLVEYSSLRCEFGLPSAPLQLSFTFKWKVVAVHHGRDVSCLVPEFVPTGRVSIQLVDEVYHVHSNVVVFEHSSSFTVKRIEPARGSADGGYVLAIHGNLFPNVPSVVCSFGGHQVIGKRVSSESVECVVPRASSQRQPRIALKFGADSDTFWDTNRTFTYLPHASVYQLRPTLGWTRGGTKVAVYGSKMPFSSSIECFFGDTAVPATYVSSRELVCESPAIVVAQRERFIVRSNGRDWDAPVPLTFETIAAPIIHAMVPTMGSSDGGTNVILRGNFTAMFARPDLLLFCSFEDNGVASARITSNGTVSCTSPPFQNQRVVNLGLFYQSDDIALTGFQFRYVFSAVFLRSTPSVVPERWEGHVAVRGLNFAQSSMGFCAFESGSRFVRSSIRFVSPQEIHCAVPKLMPSKYRIHVSINGDAAISIGKSLVVTKMPHILRMTPQVDTMTGGSVVRFEGLHLVYVPSLVCLFGVKRVPARFHNNAIICVAPNASYATVSPERVNVSLIAEGTSYITQTFLFDYVQEPQITNIEVVVAGPKFEETVVICGKDLDCPAFLKLVPQQQVGRTSKSIQGQRWNATCQRFAVQETDGNQNCADGCDMFLSVNNQVFTSTARTVVLGVTPQITLVDPRYGSTSGGDIVHLIGRNLHASAHLFCVFGAQDRQHTRREAIVRSSERVECVTPRHHAGIFNLSIELETPTSSTNSSHVIAVFDFQFIAPFELHSVSPSLGPARGGTTVTVLGKGFTMHRDLRCRFGEQSVSAIFVNSTLIQCVSPPRLTRRANVTKFFVTLGSTVATMALHIANATIFTYADPPFVRAMSPEGGIYNKYHVIAIDGTGFTSDMVLRCRFGDTLPSVEGTFVTPDRILCPLQVGVNSGGLEASLRLPLALSIDGIQYVESGFAFELFQPAVIAAVSPRAVVPRVTKEIMLTYLNFDFSADLACAYLELNVTTYAHISDWSSNTLVCSIPSVPLRPGFLSIGVVRNGLQHSSNNLTADVIQTPDIFDFSPKSGPTTMSYERTMRSPTAPLYVTVHGKNFPAFRGIQCRFGSQLSTCTFQSVNSLRCVVPDASVAKRVPLAVSFNEVDYIDVPGWYEYIDNFFVQDVVPSTGALSGGTSVLIRGGSFDANDTITCRFGITWSEQSAIVLSSTELVCILPRIDALGLVDVSIFSESRRLTGRLRNAFTLTKPLAITSVWPLAAFEKRETLFDVYGVGFWRSPTLRCSFDAEKNSLTTTMVDTLTKSNDSAVTFTHAIWVSPTHVKCMVSSTIGANPAVRIGVTNNGVDFVYAATSQAIAFFTQFDITSVYPRMGTVIGGTKVTLHGKHFFNIKQRIWCQFGSIPKVSVGFVVTADEVVCVSPPNDDLKRDFNGTEDEGLATVSLALSLNGKDFMTTRHVFTYVQQPSMSKISPTSGSTDGSTMVIVRGTNFLISGGSAWCRFGKNEVRAMVVSASELSCIAPPNEFAEFVPIEVSINDGVDYMNNGVLYAYRQPPQFRRMAPTFGPSTGGTLMEIQGLNFYPSKRIQCCFADRYHCTRGWLVGSRRRRNTTIKCRTPAATAMIEDSSGSLIVPIQVTFNGQDFFTLDMNFEYVVDPIVEAIAPAFADAAGGTVVNIIGQHFQYSSALACRFDDDLIVSATFIDASTVSCAAPARSRGQANFSVTLNGQDFTYPTTNATVTFVNVPTMYSMSIEAEPGLAVQTLRLRGSGFENLTEIVCRFIQRVEDESVVQMEPAEYVSPTAIRCKVPQMDSKLGMADVMVAVHGVTSATQPSLRFMYLEGPTTYNVNPSFGSVEGGTRLKIMGNKFTPAANLECCFEQAQQPTSFRKCVAADYLSDKVLRCVTPRFATAVPAHLTIQSNNMLATTQNALMFQVHSPIQVTQVSPERGSFRGGTRIYVSGSNFLFVPRISCCIGDVRVPATFINSTLLECTTPFYGTGAAVVLVSINGQECYGNETLTFKFEKPPVIAKITPASGSQLGGTIIVVDGANFIENRSICFFGSRQASFSEVTSESRMTCQVPPQLDHTRERLAVTNNDGRDFSTDSVFFTYIQAEDVFAVYPRRVSSAQNGGIVTLATNNVVNTGNLSCFLDDIVVRAKFEAPTQIYCSLPPHIVPGVKKVYISNDGFMKSQTFALLDVINPPTIASAYPLEGVDSGGQTVTFEGSRLGPISHCRFGDALVVARHVSAFRIECIAPRQEMNGIVSLQVLDNGAELLSEPLSFRYVDTINRDAMSRKLVEKQQPGSYDEDIRPHVTSVYPLTASATGGTNIIVRGIHFQNNNALTCHFGKVVVLARFHSPEQIVCVSPRLAPQTYRFQVSNDGGVSLLSNSRTSITTYTDAYVQSITPSYGPHTGGTAVTVFGMHFGPRTSALLCRFGGTKVQIVKFVSANEIVCIAPMQKGTASVVPVTVTTNNETYTPNPVFFTYTIVGNVVSVTPRFGPARGGTVVLVRAYNLDINDNGSVWCRIGSTAIKGELLSATLVRCVTLASSRGAGSFAVELSVNGQDFTNSHVLFEYTADISIERISPVLGPSLITSTVVTVYGFGFMNTADLVCFFDAVRSPATWHSSTEISCTAPPQVPHVVSVRVSNNGLDMSSASSSAKYLYHNDMALSRITPVIGLMEGGTPVFFKGRNFLNHTLLSCRFGELIVSATYLSDSLLNCVAPRQLTNLLTTSGRVAVDVSSNRIDFTKSGLQFTYTQHCPFAQY
uniref:IPT/TIG domain-containing protein n=1 Tax=Globisporangium ultimum (strain ATCC 200006 / CBS 805.95 / DAOM BR144) TaxID=431595 RepID=K3WKI2_GLOUD